ncbi:hypothetical protein Cni_G16897 [Canna indica]|uniref:Endonuclease/exonuclease/phosphatase domain-containing protein n=1 Tax=Canna indica TaxID=4628 RepID=A0AAQ3QH89_9LILI|nr:hypothetical protein Cni_G16897 [Canna indica]
MRESIDSIPEWIHLPGLSYKFLSSNILPQVMAVIGKPLKIDNYTVNGERGKFARVCVMLNIKEPLQQGGALKKEALAYLWYNVKQYNIEMLVLQETHMLHDEAKKFLLKYKRSWQRVFVSSIGRSGGILMLWKVDSVEVECVFKDEQSIYNLVKFQNGEVFLLTRIYASINHKKRSRLWNILSGLEINQLPWLLAGDMNGIRNEKEKMSGKEFVYGKTVRDFNNFIETNGLLEAEFVGPRFTWTNNRSNEARIHARLDRALYNASWLSKNWEVKVRHLQKVDSDHGPILITCQKERRKWSMDKQFIVEHYWFENEMFTKLVKNNWNNTNSIEATIMEKQRRLAAVLSKWNKEEVGNVEKNLKEDLEKLADFE